MDAPDDPLSKRPPSPTPAYEVGYAKPPVSTRFPKGRSGNPQGRRKGSKNLPAPLHAERLKAIILEEAYRTVIVRDGDKNISVPIAQAIVRALAVNAAKGHQRAQKLFTELLSTTERDNKRMQEQYFEVAVEYKTGWEEELARRETLGITHLPDPLPHPDDIVIDVRTGEVHFNGPITPEEKEAWDYLRALKQDLREDINWSEEQLRKVRSEKKRAILRSGHARATALLERATRILPD